jgi:hypothetical protein
MSSVKMQGGASGTGSVTLLAPNTNNTDVLTLPDVTSDTLVGAAATQTLTNKTLGSGLVAGASLLTLGTAQASTSGTSIDFTSIPSWVKRITVMFNGVSTSGTSNIQIQIGSGSVTTTGYLTGSSYISGGSAQQIQITTGIAAIINYGAAASQSGLATLTNITGNSWVSTSSNSRVDAASGGATSNGSVTLGGTLDRVRITTVNGTDTFDAGSINIQYE